MWETQQLRSHPQKMGPGLSTPQKKEKRGHWRQALQSSISKFSLNQWPAISLIECVNVLHQGYGKSSGEKSRRL